MHDLQLIYPMFAMVLLTTVVLGMLFRSRVSAVQQGQVTMKFYRTYQGEAEPETPAKRARHFINLFEAPNLFYAACLAAMVTHDSGLTAQILAWLYVLTRLIHSFIHLGGNRVKYRLRAYFASWIVLVVFWIHLVWHTATLSAMSG